MKNITLAIEEGVLSEARALAEAQGSTVNGLVRDYLTRLVEEERRLEGSKRKLRELIDNSTGRLGPNFHWSREELYEERLFPRHEHPDLRRDRETG